MSAIRRVIRPDGTRVLSIREGWSPEVSIAIEEGNFDYLSLNTGQWVNFDFLGKYCDQINRLGVSSSVTTYQGLEKLTKLVEIRLEDTPNPPLDLLVFKELQRCYLDWHKRYPPAFFALPKLNEVTLTHYSAKDCSDIAQAHKLIRLDLQQGGIQSLNGIEHLSHLKYLSLAYMRNLQDISAAASLRQLEVLHIEKCPKVVDVDFVRGLSNLQTLFIDCGSAGYTDLKWMSKLDALIDVLIAVPVQSVDWDIVFALPNLQRVVINTHPGYQIADDELFACAKAHGRVLDNYFRAGTKKHPAFKFWMAPK